MYHVIIFTPGISGWWGIVIACICPSVCPSVRPSVWPDGRLSVRSKILPCPHDDSSQIWAGITKFAPNMHPETLSAGIENGGNWPWPSRSFWPFWLKFLGNSACPHDNSSQIWARITKFAPNMHSGILWVNIENGGHWPWPSRSFWQFWLKFCKICLVH